MPPWFDAGMPPWLLIIESRIESRVVKIFAPSVSELTYDRIIRFEE